MSETLFKEVNYSLAKLVEDIDVGEIGLPDIQRPFVWPNRKVRDLFDSMYRGYPVGYLLFWANGVAEHTSTIGEQGKQKIPQLLVIDGQQRLTSLYAVLKDIPIKRKDYSEEKIKIAFCPLDESFKVTDATTRKDPAWIPDISVIWSPDTDIFDLVSEYLQRLQTAREVSYEERKRIQKAIWRLSTLDNYPFTAMELSSSTDEEQVSEIFVRVNSKGTSLNQSDFILTLMSVFWDDGRSELEEFCRQASEPSKNQASPYNPFIAPEPEHLLRVSVALGFRRARLQNVYSILRGKDLDTGQFSADQREKQFQLLESAQSYVLDLTNWQEFFKVLMRAGFRSGKFITSTNTLLYNYAFYVIGKRDFGVNHHTLRNTIARWFFMTSLTGRYTGTPESRMEQDLADLRNLSSAAEFIDHIDRIIQANLTEDFWTITLPNELATSSARSPELFAYYAALNLLDARVLFSNMKVAELLAPTAQGKKASLERHHLFPKAYLERQGITDNREVNQIANYALVEWSDNIAIADDDPAEYLPKYAERFSDDDLKRMYFWHALPEGWETMNYYDFLDERRQRMAQVIRAGFKTLKDG